MRSTCTIPACAIALLSLLAGPAAAGSNLLLFCRGGADHGERCRTDGDCSGGDGAATGICTQRGMPRSCLGRHFCRVSTAVPCVGNDQCPLWPNDPADFCARFDHTAQGCSLTAEPGSEAACGECAGGEVQGRGCLSDADCPGSACDKSPGLGECRNGAGQQQLQIFGHRGMADGKPGDIVADISVGAPTLGDNIVRTVTAHTIKAPGGITLHPSGDLLIADLRRITRRSGLDLETDFSPASGAIGQVSLSDFRWNRVSDDAYAAGLDMITAETIGAVGQTGMPGLRGMACIATPDAKNPNFLDGCVFTDHSRIVLHPLDAGTDSAAVRVWGHVDFAGTRAHGADRSFDIAVGVALQHRCFAAKEARGRPCRRDADCAGGTCGTTIAIADQGRNRIVVQTAAPAADGTPFAIVLGQSSFAGAAPNQGGRSAATLAHPGGLAFDHHGNLWVGDRDNHRVLRYPRNFETGTPADLVLGQRDFTAAEPGSGSGQMRVPYDVAFDVTANRLFVADESNHRILQFDDPQSGAGADVLYGQMEFGAFEPGTSSNGADCDRLWAPRSVATDGKHLWIADGSNNRALRFPIRDTHGTAADVLLGQKRCRDKVEGEVTPTSIGRGNGGTPGSGIWFYGTSPQGVCIGDPTAHRILCWNDRRAVMLPEEPALPHPDAILGQADGVAYDPNRDADPGPGGLHLPGFGTWTPAGQKPGIWLADTENHRILRYTLPLTTGQEAADVIGQPDFATTAPASGASGLRSPNSVTADADGNLWVADTGNGRVLLFCMQAGSLAGPGDSSVCTTGNSGDGVADLVLGNDAFDEIPPGGAHEDPTCYAGRPTPGSLCRPLQVLPVSGTIRDRTTTVRLFVGDWAGVYNHGRTVLYAAPFTSSQRALSVVGVPDRSFERFMTPEGTLTGYCLGGPTPGAPCAGRDTVDLQGAVSPACGAAGYCDQSRSAHGETFAYDAANDILYQSLGGGIAEVHGPFTEPAPATPIPGSGPRQTRLFGLTGERFWGSHQIGYTTGQWSRDKSQLALDEDGNLWAQQGALAEHNSGVFVVLQPATGSK